MKKLVWFLIVGAMGVSLVVANIDERYEKERHEKKSLDLPKHNIKLQPLYKNECGACHMAYQPEFLPKRSWTKMMNTLDDHFKVDASLDEEDRKRILNYLLSNASDSKRVYGEFREFLESIPKDKTPLKISDIPYFKKEHRKIPKRYITQKEVKSISNCIACHKKAQSGDFSEKNIDIPNYGKWED